jgi:putative sigma-54 modulation protein
MKISVQSIHFHADKKLLAFIQKKADKLDQFFDQIISAEIYLRLQKSDDESNKIAEIKLSLPGSQLFVKEKCRTFEEATDLAVETLKRLVDRHKTKIRSRLNDYRQNINSAVASV